MATGALQAQTSQLHGNGGFGAGAVEGRMISTTTPAEQQEHQHEHEQRCSGGLLALLLSASAAARLRWWVVHGAAAAKAAAPCAPFAPPLRLPSLGNRGGSGSSSSSSSSDGEVEGDVDHRWQAQMPPRHHPLPAGPAVYAATVLPQALRRLVALGAGAQSCECVAEFAVGGRRQQQRCGPGFLNGSEGVLVIVTAGELLHVACGPRGLAVLRREPTGIAGDCVGAASFTVLAPPPPPSANGAGADAAAATRVCKRPLAMVATCGAFDIAVVQPLGSPSQPPQTSSSSPPPPPASLTASHRSAVLCVAATPLPCGRALVVGGDADGSVTLRRFAPSAASRSTAPGPRLDGEARAGWEAEVVAVRRDHDDWVRCVCFWGTRHGVEVVSVGDDGVIVTWGVGSPSAPTRRAPLEEGRRAYAAACTPPPHGKGGGIDDALLAVADEHGVALFDAALERCATFVPHRGCATCALAFDPSGTLLCSGGEDESVVLSSVCGAARGEAAPIVLVRCDSFVVQRRCVSFMTSITAVAFVCDGVPPSKRGVGPRWAAPRALVIAVGTSDGAVVQWVVAVSAEEETPPRSDGGGGGAAVLRAETRSARKFEWGAGALVAALVPDPLALAGH